MPDFTDKLKPASPGGPELLAKERSQSDVPVEELSGHLFSRIDFLERQKRILSILGDDTLFNKKKQFNLSRPERFQLGLARAKKLRRLADQYQWDRDDQEMATYLCDDVSPYLVHASMFVNTVREQGSVEQRKEWLPKIESWKAIGCYAQTELGHGSNVKGIECEARWDPRGQIFTIHSPSLTASKWWNGSMGRLANHAIVVAQLYVPKSPDSTEFINYGPHAFIVQIRDLKTHKPLDGIVVGDIGNKVGYMTMDNGYLLFDHFRVPHSAMLSNYSRVDPNTCTYSKPANPAVVYGSLTAVRATIIMHARLVIARAVTIAVRYSSIRRQFQDRDSPDKSAPELSVLDYSTVQIRILPLLATAFAFHYTGQAMHDLYTNARAEIDQGDFSRLAILHAQSSGLKSYCTEIAANGIETCRRAMGGHGYMGSSGFVQLSNDYLSKPTVEGDNWMIFQQAARHLLKHMQAAIVHEGEAQDAMEQDCRNWLQTQRNSPPCRIFVEDAQIIEAFHRRSRFLTHGACIERFVKKRDWNNMLIQLRKVSHAESEFMLVTNFFEALSSSDLSATLKRHLRANFLLFALSTMDASARDFAKANAVGEADLDELPARVQELMATIRPHAVRLVDSWRIPNFLLDSSLGRSDGRVYEDLFDRAHRQNPLNDITFNPYYQDEQIVMGGETDMKAILAKL